MYNDEEFEIFGLDWLKRKLTPEDDVRAESEADLSAWTAADWEKIASRCRTGHDWVELLTFQPRFTGRCDWTKFSGDDWGAYLSEHPEFFDRCDTALLDKYDWGFLFGEQPQLAEKYDWLDFDGDKWAYLLGEMPQFAGKCPFNELKR